MFWAAKLKEFGEHPANGTAKQFGKHRIALDRLGAKFINILSTFY